MASVVGIFITGPSSTGKTTLCEALKRRLEASGIIVYPIAEVARSVMRETGFTREHVNTLEMQQAIMRAQVEAEKRALTLIHDRLREWATLQPPMVLICDRCAIDPVVYATMHLSENVVHTMTDDASFQEAVGLYKAKQTFHNQTTNRRLIVRPTVILTDGVEEWKAVDDGVRSLYDPWKVVAVFRPVLEKFGVIYHEVGEGMKDINKRVDWAIDIAGLRSFVKDYC